MIKLIILPIYGLFNNFQHFGKSFPQLKTSKKLTDGHKNINGGGQFL